jgi:integrase/recombinase XerD
MPVTIYRSHSSHCPHRSEGRKWTKCGCPIGIDKRFAFVGGKIEVLDTTDWKTAERIARDIDLGIVTSETPVIDAITLAQAQEEWKLDPKFTQLKAGTQRKHLTLHKQLAEFAADKRVSMLAEIDPTFIARFRSSWEKARIHPTNGRTVKDNPLAAAKKTERLMQFCKFIVRRGWVKANPMDGIKVKTPRNKQTPPFTDGEMKRLVDYIEQRIAKSADQPPEHANWQRMRALVLLMRFSGLRISDAVGCQIEWVRDGRVQLLATKNGARIDVPLPPYVISALDEIPAMSDLYFFWTGRSALATATKHWQAKFLKVFRGAEIQKGHAHRFRDTFAVEMLNRGETLHAVAEALGDSYEVTKRHYNPWSKERQARLDKAVSGGWQSDPVLQRLEAQARRAGKSAVVEMPVRASGGGR